MICQQKNVSRGLHFVPGHCLEMAHAHPRSTKVNENTVTAYSSTVTEAWHVKTLLMTYIR